MAASPWLLSLPVAGALSGWVAGYATLQFLFRPRRPLKILGFTLQGLIPRRKDELARRLAADLSRSLAAPGFLGSLLGRARGSDDPGPLVDRLMEHILGQSGLSRIPLVGGLAGGFLDRARPVIAAELSARLEQYREALLRSLGDREAVEKLILENLESFWGEKLENTIGSLAGKETALMALAGGAVGLAAGSLLLLAEVMR